jgi:transposase
MRVEKMGYKQGIDKNQMSIMPLCLDDYVRENHICRLISAFTQQLDMVELGFKYAQTKTKGAPPFDPRMMLGLYIYGYTHQIRSSRRLQAETTRNVEVMWLMDGLQPDDKTICNFRTDNKKAFHKVFRQFTKMLNNLGLFGAELEAVDSTKIRANNSRKNNYNPTTVELRLSRVEKQINEYMNALDENDKREADKTMPSTDEIKNALKKLQEKKANLLDIKAQVQEHGEVSTVDPDARMMRRGGDGRTLDVCYNVHTCVDAQHGLIAEYEVANNSSDTGMPGTMTSAAKEVLGVDKITALADKGFYDGDDIVACEESGVTCYVAKPKPGGKKHNEGFGREDFIYNKEADTYTCPGGQNLKFMRMKKERNGKEVKLYANYSACAKCEHRAKCTKAKYRYFTRALNQDALDVIDQRLKENKALYRKRQQIVEHPFGTIKSGWGYRQFLTRGKGKVDAETGLAFLAYNLRRAMSIFEEKKIKVSEVVLHICDYLCFCGILPKSSQLLAA